MTRKINVPLNPSILILMYNWCKDVIGNQQMILNGPLNRMHRWKVINYNSETVTFIFFYKEDATLFKLTWL